MNVLCFLEPLDSLSKGKSSQSLEVQGCIERLVGRDSYPYTIAHRWSFLESDYFQFESDYVELLGQKYF